MRLARLEGGFCEAARLLGAEPAAEPSGASLAPEEPPAARAEAKGSPARAGPAPPATGSCGGCLSGGGAAPAVSALAFRVFQKSFSASAWMGGVNSRRARTCATGCCARSTAVERGSQRRKALQVCRSRARVQNPLAAWHCAPSLDLIPCMALHTHLDAGAQARAGTSALPLARRPPHEHCSRQRARAAALWPRIAQIHGTLSLTQLFPPARAGTE